MKRSEINQAIQSAMKAFKTHHWFLPPNPKWDVTDFGLRDFARSGLVSVNLAEEPEYCEKIMFVQKNQVTPDHYHASKKEDIICRFGQLAIQLISDQAQVDVKINGEIKTVPTDQEVVLHAGERITLTQHVRHAFWALSDYAIVGEVSTANDDAHDNFFNDQNVGRFSEIEEDEKPFIKLASESC